MTPTTCPECEERAQGIVDGWFVYTETLTGLRDSIARALHERHEEAIDVCRAIDTLKAAVKRMAAGKEPVPTASELGTCTHGVSLARDCAGCRDALRPTEGRLAALLDEVERETIEKHGPVEWDRRVEAAMAVKTIRDLRAKVEALRLSSGWAKVEALEREKREAEDARDHARALATEWETHFRGCEVAMKRAEAERDQARAALAREKTESINWTNAFKSAEAALVEEQKKNAALHDIQVGFVGKLKEAEAKLREAVGLLHEAHDRYICGDEGEHFERCPFQAFLSRPDIISPRELEDVTNPVIDPDRKGE